MEPCPYCEGKCCRNDYGYRVEHISAEYYDHYCEYCNNGTKYVPPADSNLLRQDGEPWTLHMASYPAPDANSERDSIVAYLRARANAEHPIERGVPSLSPAGRGLLLLMADRIELGEHLKQEDE